MNATTHTDIEGSDVPDTSILSDTAFLNDLRRQMVKFATLQFEPAPV